MVDSDKIKCSKCQIPMVVLADKTSFCPKCGATKMPPGWESTRGDFEDNDEIKTDCHCKNFFKPATLEARPALACACQILDNYVDFAKGNANEHLDKLVEQIKDILPDAKEVTQERITEKEFQKSNLSPRMQELTNSSIEKEKENLLVIEKLTKQVPTLKYADRFGKVDFIDTFMHLTHFVEPVLANACTWKCHKIELSDLETRMVTMEVLDCLAEK